MSAAPKSSHVIDKFLLALGMVWGGVALFGVVASLLFVVSGYRLPVPFFQFVGCIGWSALGVWCFRQWRRIALADSLKIADSGREEDVGAIADGLPND